jgi:flagellar capping protein FliD
VQNFTDLGLTFDKTGKLSFDQTVFNAASAAHSSDVRGFLGSPSTGGFLKAATDILNGLDDPIHGTIQASRDSAQLSITKQNQRIADEQAHIDILQQSLIARMSAADALIASLEQQVNYFTTLFASMYGNQNK